MNALEERMNLYMDAGFPILYLSTFEEDKAMRMIANAAANRPLVEWNMRGLFHHKHPELNVEDLSLTEALKNFGAEADFLRDLVRYLLERNK